MKLEEYKRDDLNFINDMIRSQDYYLRSHGIIPNTLFISGDYLRIIFKRYPPLFSLGTPLDYVSGYDVKYCGLNIIVVNRDKYICVAG